MSLQKSMSAERALVIIQTVLQAFKASAEAHTDPDTARRMVAAAARGLSRIVGQPVGEEADDAE